jgi:hypothetical protein
LLLCAQHCFFKEEVRQKDLVNVLIQVHTIPYLIAGVLKSIWGKETCIRSIRQESMRKPETFAPAG